MQARENTLSTCVKLGDIQMCLQHKKYQTIEMRKEHKNTHTQAQREREREHVCVCVCVSTY